MRTRVIAVEHVLPVCFTLPMQACAAVGQPLGILSLLLACRRVSLPLLSYLLLWDLHGSARLIGLYLSRGLCR
jgi:hypothetical protein